MNDIFEPYTFEVTEHELKNNLAREDYGQFSSAELFEIKAERTHNRPVNRKNNLTLSGGNAVNMTVDELLRDVEEVKRLALRLAEKTVRIEVQVQYLLTQERRNPADKAATVDEYEDDAEF